MLRVVFADDDDDAERENSSTLHERPESRGIGDGPTSGRAAAVIIDAALHRSREDRDDNKDSNDDNDTMII